MYISLVTLKIEICSEFPFLEDFNFVSNKARQNEKHFIGLPKKASPDVSLELREAIRKEARGVRTHYEIHIETLTDFEEAYLEFGTVDMAELNELVNQTSGGEADPRRHKSGSSAVSSPVPIYEQVPFYSGNHCVEITKGVLHLYKENTRTPVGEAERSEMLCMLGVPASLPLHDLLQFIAPQKKELEMIRIIRDSKPNIYMVLLKFRNQQAADDFYQHFNGTHFNSIEPEVCNLVYVARVQMVREEEADLPLLGNTELPTCPVCLERMDESVEGVLTILCNHSFHDDCLAKWGDSTCPVCRYTQTPELQPDNRCFCCSTQANLWICLICGHIGCGRYEQGHAYNHYVTTEHTFAMKLGDNSVWDYAGDNYVHRLVQNKTDGKLVELDNRIEDESEEKITSVQLEYTYLLTSQLEQQRRYFEDQIDKCQKENMRQINELKEKTQIAVEERKELEAKLEQVTKDKEALRRKCDQISAQLNKIRSELTEERAINKCLSKDQSAWQKKLTATEAQLKESKAASEKQITDLQEQIRDLMFYLDAKDKISGESAEMRQEIESGIMVVPEAQTSASGNKGRSGRRKR